MDILNDRELHQISMHCLMSLRRWMALRSRHCPIDISKKIANPLVYIGPTTNLSSCRTLGLYLMQGCRSFIPIAIKRNRFF